MSSDKKQTNPLIGFQFPMVVTESMFFASKNAWVEKAVLSVNTPEGRNIILSIFKPIIPVDVTKEEPPEIDLDFFNGVPFHGGLASKWNVLLTVYTRDSRTPSIIFKPADMPTGNLTWESLGRNMYKEIVTAGSEAGQVTKTLIYLPDRGGFECKQ